MLELRLATDPKRITAMRASVARECRRATSDTTHADAVAFLAAELLSERSRTEALVVVTTHSDVTTLMVRMSGADRGALDARRRTLLESLTTRWSTMSGRDGRTILAEIPRGERFAAIHERVPATAGAAAG